MAYLSRGKLTVWYNGYGPERGTRSLTWKSVRLARKSSIQIHKRRGVDTTDAKVVVMETVVIQFTISDMKKPLTIHVYRDMLKQAEIFRQVAKKDIYKDDENARILYESLCAELYHWVAELENTEEVNPTKQ